MTDVRPHLRKNRRQYCFICGSAERIEHHHLFGRNHAPFFTIPLCRRHHELVTRMIANAGHNLMSATSDREERLRRARMACYVFLWLVEDCCAEREIKS